MTAINIITKPDAIHVLTDGAYYAPNGILLEVGAKCFALPTMDLALVGRGRKDVMPFLIAELSHRATDFDSAIDEAAGALQSVMTVAPILLPEFVQPGAFDPAFELWLIGYSRSREAFETYILPTHDRHEGLPAWQVGYVEGSICAPVPTDEAVRRSGSSVELDLKNFDPEVDGLKLLEIQRFVPSAPDMRYPEKVGCIVGGLGQLTTIRRDGMASKVLKRWPEDKIGELMNQKAFSRLASETTA